MQYRYENNDYLAVISEDDVVECEKYFGYKLPAGLRNFLLFHGCGFVEENEDEYHRILSPLDMIDFSRFSDDYIVVEYKDYYSSLYGKGLVFMEFAQEVFFWISVEKPTYGKIYYYDDCIADSFDALIKKIHNHEKVI